MDCGGSSSRALIQDANGSVLMETKSGPANWAATPVADLSAHIHLALSNAPKIDFAAICMAGVLTEDDQAEVTNIVQSACQVKVCHVYPDSMASLASCDDPNAVCVISGTGSLVCSFDDSNQLVKSGGGGPLVGDYGSGYWAGRTALARFLFPRPDTFVQSKLPAWLADRYGSQDFSVCLSQIYRTASPQAEIATIGSAVAKLATDGDETAQSILADAMQPLADLTLEHMRSQGFPQRKFKVYRTGGFWTASHYVVKYFEILLRLPTFEPTLTPLDGAMKLARKLAQS